jgi:hypothetical protein
VSSSLNNQGRWNQANPGLDRDSQPEIIVFANRKAFIEPANAVKQLLGHHNRRWTHQAKVEAGAKNIAGWLSVFGLWIHSGSLANPDFLRLTDLHFWMLIHERRLDFQLVGQPEVIGIQKRHVSALRDTDAVIAGGRHTSSLPGDQP